MSGTVQASQAAAANPSVEAAFIPPSDMGAIINPWSGLLSKAVDTAVDIWAIKETGRTIGSAYPSGQVNPGAAAAAGANQKPPFNWRPIALYGGGALAVIVGALLIKKLLK